MIIFSTPEECRRWAEAVVGASKAVEGPFVATIGNFDGVHLGHRALIRHTVRRARELGRRSLVVTFDPHPASVLSDKSPLALTCTEQRLELIRDLGADVVLLIPFTRVFATLTAGEFLREVLVGILNTRELFVGYDFRMGQDQADAEALAAAGHEAGIRVTRVGAVLHGGEPVSSTRIRDALSRGDLDAANAMLGRPHAVRGEVVHGAGRGGPLLGFPTANVEVKGLLMPSPAIYATTSRLIAPEAACGRAGERFRLKPSGKPDEMGSTGRTGESRTESGGYEGVDLPSVTSFGRNPTFTGVGDGARLTLETFILDFTVDIYGRVLEVAFVKPLRGEQKFSGPDELVKQLNSDVAARRIMK